MNEQLKALIEGKKVLRLPLSQPWYDKIYEGIKPEEYRDQKAYYDSRLLIKGEFKEFDYILFVNGYGAHRPHMLVEWKGTSLDRGKEEWGAVKDVVYYVLHLGKVVYESSKITTL